MEEQLQVAINWIKKAENDLKTAKDEINTEAPATDTVCFHAQQCVEKYLKSYLVFHKKHFKKIHNIAKLIEHCKELSPDFDILFNFEADKLTVYATEVRYGEEFFIPTIEEARKSIEIAEDVKRFVLEKFKKEGVEI